MRACQYVHGTLHIFRDPSPPIAMDDCHRKNNMDMLYILKPMVGDKLVKEQFDFNIGLPSYNAQGENFAVQIRDQIKKVCSRIYRAHSLSGRCISKTYADNQCIMKTLKSQIIQHPPRQKSG